MGAWQHLPWCERSRASCVRPASTPSEAHHAHICSASMYRPQRIRRIACLDLHAQARLHETQP
eukprot:8075-Eustigmatos_ZCMA.PRE.1